MSRHLIARLTSLVLCATLLVVAASSAMARDLAGRVYLGNRTQLHLEEDESLLTDLLRAVKLVNRDVPVLNLNSIAIQGDYLFVGEDHELFFLDKNRREIYHVGTAQDLSNFKLFDGVKLKAVDNPAANFESGQREVSLKVVMTKDMEVADPSTKRARFAHWLAEMDCIWDETLMTDGAKRNYTILMNALSTALPDGENEDPRAFEHLKLLKNYIEAATYPSAEPLKQLVSAMLKRVRAAAEQEDTAQAAKDVLPAYQKLEGILEKAGN